MGAGSVEGVRCGGAVKELCNVIKKIGNSTRRDLVRLNRGGGGAGAEGAHAPERALLPRRLRAAMADGANS
jgi:hypothetical protein